MFDLIAAWFAVSLFVAGTWTVVDSFGGGRRRGPVFQRVGGMHPRSPRRSD